MVPPESQAAAPELEHDGRQQSRSRHLFEAHRGEPLDSCTGGKRTLPADDVGATGARPKHDRRQFPAGPIEVRLDDLQHEARRDGGIECIAASLENRHPGVGRKPMGRLNGPERGPDVWSCRECRLHRTSVSA